MGRVLGLGVFLCILAVLVVEYNSQSARLQSLLAEETLLAAQEAELKLEQSRLQHLVDYARTEGYVEQMARDTLGWVKQGERKYFVPGN